MRRRILIAALVSVLSACTQETEDIIVNKSNDRCIFDAVVEGDAATRASIGNRDSDGNYPMIFNEGDNISVVGKQADPYNAKLTLVAGAGTTQAKFDGECSLPDEGYYVVYPYKKKTKPEHTGAYSPYMPDIWWNGQKQTATPGSFDPKKGIMVAYSEDTSFPVSITFKQVCSYIKFTTNYKCKKITFEALDSTNIACEHFTVRMVDDEPSVLWANSQTAKITLKAPGDSIIPAGTYYIAALPKELSEGFRITFKSATADWKEYSKATSKKVTLQRGHVLNLGEIDLAANLTEFAGSGTFSSPYLVSDLEELKLVSTRVSNDPSKYAHAVYSQTKDIDVKGEALEPIGNADNMFEGTYLGNGHKISNPEYKYVINKDGTKWNSADKYVYGLFGNIKAADISGVNVENPKPYDNSESNPSTKYNECGMIVGHAFSDDDVDSKCIIENCRTSGAWQFYFNTKYNGGVVHAGGIVGVSNANIQINQCINNTIFENMPGSSSFNPALGGILGYSGPVQNYPGDSDSADAQVIIERCRNNADIGFYIEGMTSYLFAVGGILGKAYDGWFDDVCIRIGNCVNTGKVYMNGKWGTSIYETSVGGIVGENDSDGYGTANDPEIFNCLNRGTVVSSGTCFWTNKPDRIAYSGSIVGKTYDDDTYIHMCVNKGHFSFELSDEKLKESFCGDEGTIKNCFTWNDDLSPSYLNSVLLNETYHYGSKARWYTNSHGDLDLYIIE